MRLFKSFRQWLIVTLIMAYASPLMGGSSFDAIYQDLRSQNKTLWSALTVSERKFDNIEIQTFIENLYLSEQTVRSIILPRMNPERFASKIEAILRKNSKQGLHHFIWSQILQKEAESLNIGVDSSALDKKLTTLFNQKLTTYAGKNKSEKHQLMAADLRKNLYRFVATSSKNDADIINKWQRDTRSNLKEKMRLQFNRLVLSKLRDKQFGPLRATIAEINSSYERIQNELKKQTHALKKGSLTAREFNEYLKANPIVTQIAEKSAVKIGRLQIHLPRLDAIDKTRQSKTKLTLQTIAEQTFSTRMLNQLSDDFTYAESTIKKLKDPVFIKTRETEHLKFIENDQDRTLFLKLSLYRIADHLSRLTTEKRSIFLQSFKIIIKNSMASVAKKIKNGVPKDFFATKTTANLELYTMFKEQFIADANTADIAIDTVELTQSMPILMRLTLWEIREEINRRYLEELSRIGAQFFDRNTDRRSGYSKINKPFANASKTFALTRPLMTQLLGESWIPINERNATLIEFGLGDHNGPRLAVGKTGFRYMRDEGETLGIEIAVLIDVDLERLRPVDQDSADSRLVRAIIANTIRKNQATLQIMTIRRQLIQRHQPTLLLNHGDPLSLQKLTPFLLDQNTGVEQ